MSSMTQNGEQESHANGNPAEIVVDWDGPEDTENPLNWPQSVKLAATVIVSLFTFLTPFSSSMIAPASASVARDFSITDNVLIAMITSIFILAYAIGPLVIGPLSELYGRTLVLQLANLFFFIWNLACGFAQTEAELIVFRFLAGLGGSAPLAIGAGTLGDIWRAEERGKAIAIYSLAPLLAPAMAPVLGALIAAKSTWRWVFWSSSMFTVIVQLAGLHYLKESYAPLLLQRKAKRIQLSQATEKDSKRVRTIYETPGQPQRWQSHLVHALIRPFALFGREPIVQLLGLYMAFIYGIFYLFLTTIPSIFGDVYHHRTEIAGLHYLALGLGVSISSQLNARYMDKIYISLKEKNKGVAEPEYRVPAMVPGALVLPIGLLLSGWAAEKRLHWIVTDIGMTLVGGGMILSFQSMQAYVVDTFTLFAASALAAVSCLRSLAGFGFPLFAPKMYSALGYGWGMTVLAIVSMVLGWPAPFLFWKFGKTVRMKSRYVTK